jgi:hypothetical protein
MLNAEAICSINKFIQEGCEAKHILGKQAYRRVVLMAPELMAPELMTYTGSSMVQEAHTAMIGGSYVQTEADIACRSMHQLCLGQPPWRHSAEL